MPGSCAHPRWNEPARYHRYEDRRIIVVCEGCGLRLWSPVGVTGPGDIAAQHDRPVRVCESEHLLHDWSSDVRFEAVGLPDTLECRRCAVVVAVQPLLDPGDAPFHVEG
jgi:hypothetical protein